MKKHLLFTSIFLLGTFFSQAQWQPDVRLTNDPASSGTVSYPNGRCIASNGDTVHIVWQDMRDGASGEILYKRSTDGGINWEADKRISFNVFTSRAPAISVSGSVVIIVWSDKRDGIYDNNYEIYYCRSTDGGTSWSTDTRLTNNPSISESPSVSVSGQVVHVVWDDYRDGVSASMYYKRSADAGISWGDDTHMMNAGEKSAGPCVATSGSDVHIVWNAHGPVGYTRSTDGGLSWQTNSLLTNDTVIANNPTVEVSGSVVHATWLDSRNSLKYQIYYKNSTNGGVTWNEDTRLTMNYNSPTLRSSLAVSGSDVHVIWDDNPAGNYEIYYLHSADGGVVWKPETRLTNNPAYSMSPFLSASSSGVHVIWTDNRDGNNEIYYKRNPTNSEVGIRELSSSVIQFTVFPNPASSEIKVRSLENINEITITDMFGKEIYHSDGLNPKPELLIPVSDFPAGIYFIKLKNGKRISTQKFIKL